jgi:beta-lactam-binding protein with PASTA domain
LINVIIAIIAFIIFLWLIIFGLSQYTKHGENIHVPDLTSVTIEDAQGMLEDSDLSYEVIDSAVFNVLYPPYAVIEQFPRANAEVKSGRVIKLTINPAKPRKIELPNVVEKTTRRAIHYLESKGLKSGELIYVPDIARDRVLGLRVGDDEVEPGAMLEPGTVVDLIVGKGLSDELIKVPYLKFLTLEEAQMKLSLASLNMGVVFFDEEVEDSTSAVIYKQAPRATQVPKLKLGSDVDLWLTNDYTKIENDSLLFVIPSDTLGIDSTINYADPQE